MNKKAAPLSIVRQSEKPVDPDFALYLRRPVMSPEGHEKARKQLLDAGLLKASDREYKLLDKVDHSGNPYQTWERPDMSPSVVSALRARLVKSGIVKQGVGFQKLIDQGVLYPTSTYGDPQYVQYAKPGEVRETSPLIITRHLDS